MSAFLTASAIHRWASRRSVGDKGRAATVVLLIGVLHIIAGRVDAQETRAEAIQEEQAQRATTAAPSPPIPLGRVFDKLEDWGVIGGTPRGPYPWMGSVYPGGGFAAGAGYRKPFADDGAFKMFGGYSMDGFTRAQTDLALPTFARNRGRITLAGRYIDATDVRFYGVGNDSSKDDLTRFGYTPTSGGVRIDFGGKFVSFDGGVEILEIETSGGRTAPSIEDRFSPSGTPGLGVSTFDYVNSRAGVAIDWRKPLGYSGRGGLYRVQFDDYRELNDDLYSFRSVEAELLQLIPILRANWVLALRGLATVADLDNANVVPFFMLPSLGGGSTLRGYPDFRFRDRTRLLMNAELRWTPARFLDMAVFYDTGKVAGDYRDLDLDGLKNSYGIGMRLIGIEGYVFRIEAARSREHAARLIFNAGGAF
jgi:hypothetical protein